MCTTQLQGPLTGIAGYLSVAVRRDNSKELAMLNKAVSPVTHLQLAAAAAAAVPSQHQASHVAPGHQCARNLAAAR